MIYLKNHKYTQSVFIPKGYEGNGDAFTLCLHGTMDLNDLAIQVTDERKKGGYWLFTFSLPEEIPEGEYAYEVRQGDEVFARGLAVVQYDEQEIEQYNKDIEYEQYEG